MPLPLRFTVAILLACAPAAAGQSGPPRRDQSYERVVEQQLAGLAPDQVGAFHEATRLLDEGGHARALSLFQQVLRAAPGFTPALRRAGYCLVRSGQIPEGIAALEHAVRAERSADNLIALAAVLSSPTGTTPGPKPYLQKALALALEAVAKEPAPSKPDNLLLTAQIGLMAEDEAALGTASAGLLAHFPQHPLGHYFAAIHAATKSDWLRADTEIDAAERLGLAHDGAQALRDSGVHRRAVAWRTGYTVMAALAVWAAGLLVLFAAGRYFSGATLRSIEVSDPNAPLSDRERALRQRYRVLVRAAGVYYYVSLPFVVVLVLATAGGVFAIFLWLGRLPIQLLLAVGVGALVTIYKMVQSLFVKVEHVESGRRLEPSEAPGLWRLVHEVAAAVDTRPVDEIRVTPGTDMAVYERGTSQEKERDQATRVLLIGVGLFEGFRQRALRAVVAHEYGHFSNRDTAGGDVALRVRLDMAKFGMAMVRHGQNTWWNVAFHFLRLYAVIFRRISHGATRLQEVLADRVAAQLYGPGPFEEGLRHAIRREVEFDALASREAERAARGRLSFTDVYGDTLPDDAGIDDAVAQLLARPTTDDDSHPSPVDRFRLVNRVVGAPTADDPGMVWDLFADPALLRAEMTALIDGNVKAQAAAV